MNHSTYTEHASARVSKRTKELLSKHNIPVRSAIERGVDSLLSPRVRLEEEIRIVECQIKECKMELLGLELDHEELMNQLQVYLNDSKSDIECIHESIHFSEACGGDDTY